MFFEMITLKKYQILMFFFQAQSPVKEMSRASLLSPNSTVSTPLSSPACKRIKSSLPPPISIGGASSAAETAATRQQAFVLGELQLCL